MWVFQILNHMSDMKVTHCVLFGKTDQRGDSANSIHFVTSWRKSMKFPPRPWKFTSSKMVRRLFAKVIQMVPTAKFPRFTVRVRADAQLTPLPRCCWVSEIPRISGTHFFVVAQGEFCVLKDNVAHCYIGSVPYGDWQNPRYSKDQMDW